MSAVEELQNVGFATAVTVERLLQDRKAQAALARSVVIVDEAGMLSGRQMSELLQLAERSSARLVFCGDTKQIQSVEAGDALRVLEKESRLKSVSLLEVQRQTDRPYRQAIEELRRNPEKGFERLEQIGAVREIASTDRAEVVAAAYTESQAQRNRKGQPASTLVVCATHAEIERVTEAIRAIRSRDGRLGESRQVGKHVSLGWTSAQKCDLRNYRTGQVIGFHRAVKGIAKHECLEVIRTNEKGVVACNGSGEERTITRKQILAFDVFERRQIEVARGDRLLLTANRRGQGLRVTNGEIVDVHCVDVRGQIHLEDGRTVPPDYRYFTHGYALRRTAARESRLMQKTESFRS